MPYGATQNYAGRKDPPTSGYRSGICAVERIEVVNDYEIVMHCKVVCLDMPFYYSEASNVMIFSKAQWDFLRQGGKFIFPFPEIEIV